MKNSNAIGIEFILVIASLFFASLFCDKNIFSQDIGTIWTVVGMIWLVITILTAFLKPIEQTICSAILAIIIMFIAAPHASDPHQSYSQDVMGNCPQAEWQFVITYKKYGLKEQQIYTFTGDSTHADMGLVYASQKWTEENPQDEFVKAEKILCYIPESYAKQNGYPMDLTKRY